MNCKIVASIMMLGVLLGLSACGQNTAQSNSTTPSFRAATIQSVPLGAPSISGFQPAWQSEGSTLTIQGTNFDPIAANNAVTFANNAQGTVAAATSTELMVVVPAGAITGPVSIATSGGSATSSTMFVKKTSGGAASPTITQIPARGVVGSTIVIAGNNFATVPQLNQVTFNGTPALVTKALAASLEVTVPDGQNGNITVTTPGGTAISASPFYFDPQPSTALRIESFTPLRAAAGTSVNISGINFDPVAANNLVKFNGVSATITAASASSVSATVPVGVSSGPITVTVGGVTAKSAAIFSVPVVPKVGLMGGAMQGAALNLLGTALTYAGGGVVNSAADGSGATARFNNPNGMVTDGVNPILYVADSGNRIIRRLDFSVPGVVSVTTLAGSGLAGKTDGTGVGASFSTPNGIATDGVSLFIADSGNNRIRKITPLTGTLATMTSANAQVTTLAGSGSLGFNNNVIGINAQISSPKGITTDGVSLYVTDSTNRIRQIDITTTSVTTLAGSGAASTADGTGTAASFYRPQGITISPDNSTLYVADSGTNVIRKLTIATGQVSTLMGPGFFYASGAQGMLQNPSGMSVSSDGLQLYVADKGNHRILQVDLANTKVTTVAGSKTAGAVNDVGVLATFRQPSNLVMFGANMYVADSGNNLIRQIDIATQAVTTFAGDVVQPSNINGVGVSSKFYSPYAITTDGANLFIADSGGQSIRKIVIATGVVTTLAGGGMFTANGSSGMFTAIDGRSTAASFNFPFGITTDGTYLYVADTGNNLIRQVLIATGDVTTLAGSGRLGGQDGVGSLASFNQPKGITTDGANLYVADSENHKIRKIEIATATVTTLAGTGVVGAVDATDGLSASFRLPAGITTDGVNLYVADSGNNKIRQVSLSTGAVTTLAGSGAYWYNDVYDTVVNNWPGSDAHFRNPTGITTDGTFLYVADADNNQIRKVEIATRIVTNLTGTVVPGSTDGTGTEASLSQPVGITTDGVNLFTTEYQNNLIRKIQ